MEMGFNNKNMKKNKKYLKIIKSIESARGRNNINWMNILRLALKIAPIEAKKILKNINLQDRKISQLLKKLEK